MPVEARLRAKVEMVNVLSDGTSVIYCHQCYLMGTLCSAVTGPDEIIDLYRILGGYLADTFPCRPSLPSTSVLRSVGAV